MLPDLKLGARLTQRRGDAEARRGVPTPANAALSLGFLCVSLHLCASASNQAALPTVSATVLFLVLPGI